MSNHDIVCAHCGKPATCVGRYETMTIVEAACDDCCAHGCEDGYCTQINEEDEWDYGKG